MRFPVEQLRIEMVEFTPSVGSLSIAIHLDPFEYLDGETTKSEKTSIMLPDIVLGKQAAHELSGRKLIFPTNPTAGYIDGSVYIQHAHHPFDVTAIEFGETTEAGIRARFSANFALSFEGLGEYEDTSWIFELAIPCAVLAALR
jgi:hypothetical protein